MVRSYALALLHPTLDLINSAWLAFVKLFDDVKWQSNDYIFYWRLVDPQ